MEFSIALTHVTHLGKKRTDCIVVGVFEGKKLSSSAMAMDRLAQGHLTRILKRGDIEGRVGTSLLLYDVPHTLCERVLLIGLGKESDFSEKQYRDALVRTVRILNDTSTVEAVVCLPELTVKDKNTAWKVRHAVIAASEALYRFDQLKSKKEVSPEMLKKIEFTFGRDQKGAQTGLLQGKAISAGMALAKDLGNLPSNICTPTYLAEQAKTLAKTLTTTKLKVEILEKKDMERLGMGSLLSVTKGSHQPPKFIVLHYQGSDKKDRPVVLVGKGITFDTGGISLKPGADMDEMKFDMCGAASVLGTLTACSHMQLKQNVIGVIPTCENMPGGSASKPGDVVTSMSGQTIEILNTDAEGRLILCDALSYAERFNPALVIDIATLTGACVIALGHVACGLYSNNDSLANDLLKSGDEACDRAWRMPLWDDYQEQLKSNFADMANIGGRAAGSITAACFLARFTKKYKWAHLDIAGTAWKSGKDKGATGRPVPLLTHFLMKLRQNA